MDDLPGIEIDELREELFLFAQVNLIDGNAFDRLFQETAFTKQTGYRASVVGSPSLSVAGGPMSFG